jgi:hypothetical protein
MADGFDPCECVWSHEMAMQRLMNLLRQSQSYCTDTECIQDMPGAPADPSAGGFNMMMMMMVGWLVIATALFLLRPASLRRRRNEKPSMRDQNDRGPEPPAPSVH